MVYIAMIILHLKRFWRSHTRNPVHFGVWSSMLWYSLCARPYYPVLIAIIALLRPLLHTVGTDHPNFA